MPIESFSSVPAMLLHRVKATPDSHAFYYPDNLDNWRTLTWKDVEVECREIAGGLHSLGLELEDRCAIASNTRYEWVLVDLGICVQDALQRPFIQVHPQRGALILSMILEQKFSLPKTKNKLINFYPSKMKCPICKKSS